MIRSAFAHILGIGEKGGAMLFLVETPQGSPAIFI